MIELRRAEPADVRDVFALVCELEQGGDERFTYDAFAPVYLANVDDSNVYYLLAVEDGRVVGFASLHVQRLLHHAGAVAEAQELVVTADHQGRGLGARLLNALREEALRRGCLQIELCCNRKRVASNEFYGHMGFEKSHYKHTLKF